MIDELDGDLLDSGAAALVNAVNCVGVMGKGIALEFKRRFPANFAAYREACAAGEVVPGRMLVCEDDGRVIVNFPTKKHWRAKSRLGDVEAGLDGLVCVIRERGLDSVAVPALGVGNGGLDWADVSRLVHEKLGGLPGVAVELYRPLLRSIAPGA
ncbi:macro domain-containing protein [Actinophytocola sp. NPDC049390]|uniref:macro domain-containing protein n=1 Tax=Actinophytocola sp. NPDC049390 TaxID=3363894 RepID=UPI00379C81D5